MRRKVIFVDDEEEILDLYQEIFGEYNFIVYTEKNPLKGLKTIRKENIQVMFFDLKMSELSGVELCKEIRKKNKVALIHAVTGHSSLFELAEIREAGFDDYFTKPVKPELLINAANQSFHKLQRWAEH